MKSRLHRIEITNFKAFREFKLDLEGRHLLVYGLNGSGKSSLYWALYTFLQSARKPTASVSKYFDSSDGQNLLNIFEQEEDDPKSGEIALTFRDQATSAETKALPPGEFHSLTVNLKAARKYLLQDLQSNFYVKVLKTVPKTNRELVIPADDTDIDGHVGLDAETKGRLKSQRRMLRKLVVEDHADVLRRIEIIDEVLACTSRVLNPAAHAGDPPIYEKEVEDALNLVKQWHPS